MFVVFLHKITFCDDCITWNEGKVGYSNVSLYEVKSWIKKKFPEVDADCHLAARVYFLESDGHKETLLTTYTRGWRLLSPQTEDYVEDDGIHCSHPLG